MPSSPHPLLYLQSYSNILLLHMGCWREPSSEGGGEGVGGRGRDEGRRGEEGEMEDTDEEED